MVIIGINAFHGDASAAAIVDGSLVAAAEEERFNRVKHCAGFPTQALRYVVRAAGISPNDIGIIAVARDPWARFLQKAWYGIKIPRAATDRLKVQSRFLRISDAVSSAVNINGKALDIRRVEHHQAHLASSFLVSPFEEAALLSIDGLGDFASAMWGIGRANRIESHGDIAFPHSLGIFYTAITQYLGFPRYGDEYKVMGLASYGSPQYLDTMRDIAQVPMAGQMQFHLSPDYFVHHRSRTEMTWNQGEPTLSRLYSDRLVEKLGPPRLPNEPLEQRHYNIAASLQRRLEEIVLAQLRALQRMTHMHSLCLAGGVAFNCVTNGKILGDTGFKDIYIQSAAGDAGLAIGAAMHVWNHQLGNPRSFVMEHSYWGPEYSEEEVFAAIAARSGELSSAECRVIAVDDEPQLYRVTASEIANGKVIGWFQGRMEWGPRALGNRSILADPRRVEMREILNLKIKHREPFRPFAPSILEEATSEYFMQSHASPFMLMAYEVHADQRHRIPATTHVDGTGRLQTVNEQQNCRYYRLIKEFYRQTGVPVLLNTSFNENEPVVCSPAEALDCFLRTKMDLIVLGNVMICRQQVPNELSAGRQYTGHSPA